MNLDQLYKEKPSKEKCIAILKSSVYVNMKSDTVKHCLKTLPVEDIISIRNTKNDESCLTVYEQGDHLNLTSSMVEKCLEVSPAETHIEVVPSQKTKECLSKHTQYIYLDRLSTPSTSRCLNVEGERSTLDPNHL